MMLPAEKSLKLMKMERGGRCLQYLPPQVRAVLVYHVEERFSVVMSADVNLIRTFIEIHILVTHSVT